MEFKGFFVNSRILAVGVLQGELEDKFTLHSEIQRADKQDVYITDNELHKVKKEDIKIVFAPQRALVVEDSYFDTYQINYAIRILTALFDYEPLTIEDAVIECDWYHIPKGPVLIVLQIGREKYGVFVAPLILEEVKEK